MIPWHEAKVHVLTHTLHYGMGAFEGIRAYETPHGAAIFRLDAHVKRLFDSLRILEMDIPYSPEEIAEVCVECMRRNRLGSGYIRPVCFYGADNPIDLGLRPDRLPIHVAVAVWRWDTYLGQEALERGIRVKTSSFARHHVNAAMCKAKANGHYINSMLALREALSSGYDEALFLDTEGYAAEGTSENLFIVRGGRLYTPDTASALEGITRDTVIQLARERGYAVTEKRISRDEIYLSDEAFFTGTAAEVTPVRELDNRPIGTGKPGEITLTLQRLYFDLVQGRSGAHPEWLHYIDESDDGTGEKPRRKAG